MVARDYLGTLAYWHDLRLCCLWHPSPHHEYENEQPHTAAFTTRSLFA